MVTEGVTPFFYACWDVCMHYFTLKKGRWYDEARNNALLCITKSIGQFKSLLIQEAEANLLSKRTWNCRVPPTEELQANFELNCTFRWQSTCSGSTLKKWYSCLTLGLEEEETANFPTGKESGLELPALPYLFGDSVLVDSALELLQLCSNGSELCCPHCLTQDLPTVPATSNPWLVSERSLSTSLWQQAEQSQLLYLEALLFYFWQLFRGTSFFFFWQGVLTSL